MKIVAISDTHNLHRHWGRAPWGDLPAGDVLVHCGDFTTHGEEEEYQVFLDWLKRQPHQWKVFIAGNHDRCMEGVAPFHLPDYGIHYLRDSSVELDGLIIYGTPAHRQFQGFPFGVAPEDETDHWGSLPSCDILLTHGPAYGHCDDEPDGSEDHLGMPGLAGVLEHPTFVGSPRLHLCGHVHHAATRVSVIAANSGCVSMNCSVHQWLWKQNPVQLPVTIKI